MVCTQEIEAGQKDCKFEACLYEKREKNDSLRKRVNLQGRNANCQNGMYFSDSQKEQKMQN